MKRKLLSILLCLAMALSLLPTAALADGEKVAKVGDTAEYTTLADAIAAAQDGATVTLLANVTEDVTVPADKNVTLDLNGHNITNKSGHTITVEKGGELNISDSVGTGVVDNTSHGKGAIVNSGEVTLNGGTFKRSAEKGTYSPYSNGGNSWYTIANYGTMKINTGVTVENAGGYSSMIRNGGEEKDGVTSDCNLTINGGNFAGGLNTVKNDSFGVLTIKGGNFSNTAQYVIMNWNKAEIAGGTFQTLDTASAVLFTSSYGNDANTVGKLTVSGGEFKRTSGTQEMIVDHYDASNSGTAAVTGGKFDADISKYIPTDYVQSADGTVEKLGETNAVAKVGGTYYKTLADAYAAASEDGNAEITLLKSTTISSGMEIRKPVTLNLGGNVLTSEDYGFDVYKNFTLKNGTLNTATWGVWVQNSGVKFTLEAETVINADCNTDRTNAAGVIVVQQASADIKGKVTAQHNFAVSGNGSAGWGGVTINVMPGAEISTTEDAPALYFPNSTYLTITGGSITGGTGAYVKSGSVTISGGTIIGTGAKAEYKYNGNGSNSTGDALVVETCKYPGGAPSVSITGGKFKSVNASAIGSYAGNGETVPLKDFITGGLFSSDPSAYVAAGHYVDGSNNGDYPYTVKVGTKTDAPIIVKDNTTTTVPDVAGLTTEDKTNISQNTKVDGVAEAIADNKATLVGSAANGADKVEVKVDVKVEVTGADLTSENKTLTFTATPVATITVTKDGNSITTNDVAVPNSLLNKPITVKLPLPTVDGKLFTPKQIKHTSSDGSVEYFLDTQKTGAKTFEIKDGCAVFTITKFSTFELSGKVTYVAPSYSGGSSSYDPTYSVSTPSKTEHGSVTVSPKNASKGDRVTVTVKPDSGYVLETLTVTDKNGNELTLKDKGNGKYTFTMPAGKVEVKATFMEDNSMLNFFYDVPNNAYFYEAVKWAVKNGITTGVGNNLFAPEQPCTRAQIVTFLWRAAGSPEPKGAASGMTDVVSGSYYEKAVAWAIENGITTGTTTSTFSPDATCTRAQAVTFLARALKAKAASAAEFSDVPTDSYFADAVAWAAANGVTEGIGGGLFGSDNDCTRGQIVTFLYRAYQGK